MHRFHRAHDSSLVSADSVRSGMPVPGSDATIHLIPDGDLNVIVGMGPDG